MKNRSKIIIIVLSFIGTIVLFGISNSFTSSMIHDVDRSNSIQNYDAIEATCNYYADDADQQPDGECFINAFDECKSASIKQMSFTFEGDPIFYHAQVVMSEPCTISFTVDTSQDQWGGSNKGIDQKICTDIILTNHDIILLCNDDGMENIFPLG